MNYLEKVSMGLVILAVTIIGCIGYPLYNVWSSEQAGIAELRKAEGNRKLLSKKLKLKKKVPSL